MTKTQSLTVGFVVGGLLNRDLLIRGVGPSLADYGVANPVGIPLLTVYGITSYSAGAANNKLAQDTAAVGAFPLTTFSDQAQDWSLPAGSYTAQVTAGGPD